MFVKLLKLLSIVLLCSTSLFGCGTASKDESEQKEAPIVDEDKVEEQKEQLERKQEQDIIKMYEFAENEVAYWNEALETDKSDYEIDEEYKAIIIILDYPGLKILANRTLNGTVGIEEWNILVNGYATLSQRVYEETRWFCSYFIGDIENDTVYVTTSNEEVTFDIVESLLSSY